MNKIEKKENKVETKDAKKVESKKVNYVCVLDKKEQDPNLKKDDSNEDEHKSLDIADSDYELFYNSIFYGQLTQNWIKVTN